MVVFIVKIHPAVVQGDIKHISPRARRAVMLSKAWTQRSKTLQLHLSWCLRLRMDRFRVAYPKSREFP